MKKFHIRCCLFLANGVTVIKVPFVIYLITYLLVFGIIYCQPSVIFC